MQEYKKKIEEEQKVATKKKAMIPNLSRLLGNLAVYYFVPSELSFFHWIILFICLYSSFWFVLELLIVLDYRKYKFLPYIPATSDLISAFVLIYLTGSGNSAFIVAVISFIVVSMLFSSDTHQSIYLVIMSSSLYILLLVGLYFEVYPYVNLLNFQNNKNLANYIFSFGLLFIILVGMFNSVRMISKANVELNEKLKQLIEVSDREKNRSESLLLNILPFEIAEELKDKGIVQPVFYESVTILFTDFVGFTIIAEHMSPEELIKTLDASFTKFDKIIERYKLEKLKTIGDSYMCAGGLPIRNRT
ncbi:MAG TPA: adenylate/guanylate cyclase domain-containing protein, partial [Leptospiraceae bacterium]|nr:adenylate/guanylate cyclase domain-containing protein [Leptospiraceae bacterium]